MGMVHFPLKTELTFGEVEDLWYRLKLMKMGMTKFF